MAGGDLPPDFNTRNIEKITVEITYRPWSPTNAAVRRNYASHHSPPKCITTMKSVLFPVS
jgi:hypothetical protein